MQLAEAGCVFEHEPGLVGVEVDLDEILVAHGEQAVALEVLGDLVEHLVLSEVVALDEHQGVKDEFQHDGSSEKNE